MKNKLSVFAALCALFCLIAASPQAIVCCREGLRLCAELIIPSLFPFFVLSALLRMMGLPQLLGALFSTPAEKLFGVSGAGISALFIGLTGGYPMGAACIGELEREGQINTREAQKLLFFCNNSGPAFLVGAVGAGVFGSVRAGILLYAVHAAAAIAAGLLQRFFSRSAPAPAVCETAPALAFGQALPEAVRQSVPACLNVCGFVLCFTVFTGLLDANGLFTLAAHRLSAHTGLSSAEALALMKGLLELGSGVGALRGLPLSPRSLALSAFLLGWGGLSVHFQTLALLADSNMKSAPHTAGRLTSACISAALAYGLGLLL